MTAQGPRGPTAGRAAKLTAIGVGVSAAALSIVAVLTIATGSARAPLHDRQAPGGQRPAPSSQRPAPSSQAPTPRPPAPAVWQPPAAAAWQWVVTAPLVTTNATLMGTGVTAYNGDAAPADNPTVYDIDGVINPASTVAELHRLDDRAICYVDVGAAGDYYTAAQEGVATTYYAQLRTAGDLGDALPGYPAYFVDINAPSAVSIIESMIGKQCAGKGFDAVETGLDETFGGIQGVTGFTITQADEESYLATLAGYAHSHGLGWIASNLDAAGSASFVSRMEPLAQGIVTEKCNQYGTCRLLQPFVAAGKWVGNAEFAPETLAGFCLADDAANINGVLFPAELGGGRRPCR